MPTVGHKQASGSNRKYCLRYRSFAYVEVLRICESPWNRTVASLTPQTESIKQRGSIKQQLRLDGSRQIQRKPSVCAESTRPIQPQLSNSEIGLRQPKGHNTIATRT